MPFETGQSGNPLGRPRGSKNKATNQVKTFIETLLTDQTNTEKIKTEFAKLEGKDLIKAFIDLSPYVVPKLQATSLEINPEDLTEEQLDYIIDKIKEMHR